MRGTIPSREARHSSRGFSLVELMVVIGIISLLIGIALPAFSHAKTAAKVATTTATINAIATGLDTFRADERLGGEYPPSQYTTLPYNPHLLPGAKQPVEVMGANLAVYALAGADLLGSAGIRDANGYTESGYPNWADDLSVEPNGLYRKNSMGTIDVSRTSFVDVSKMKFPQQVVGSNPPFKMPTWDKGLNSLAFLDSFDQPILYYRAKQGSLPFFVGRTPPTQQSFATYNMWDNTLIAGQNSGINFGAGTRHFETGIKGPVSSLSELFNPNNRESMRKSFAYTLWNPNVTAMPTAHNAETYVLLSAGPDGVFGTEDDVANFPTNK